MIRSFFLIKFQLSREQVHFQILTLVAFHNIFLDRHIHESRKRTSSEKNMWKKEKQFTYLKQNTKDKNDESSVGKIARGRRALRSFRKYSLS